MWAAQLLLHTPPEKALMGAQLPWVPYLLISSAQLSCKENVKYCLTISILENVQTISIWAEGVNGDVTLNIRGIYATGCNGVIDGSLSNIGIVGKDVSKTTYLVIAMMVIIGGFAYL